MTSPALFKVEGERTRLVVGSALDCERGELIAGDKQSEIFKKRQKVEI